MKMIKNIFLVFVLIGMQMTCSIAESFDVDVYTFEELLIIQSAISTELINRYSDSTTSFDKISSVELDEFEQAALDGLKDLQTYLLNPNSLILYYVYFNQDYNGSPAVMVYFGSQNRMGGITDDSVFICNGKAQFESKFNEAVEAGDNKTVRENGDYVMAQFSIASGDAEWILCDATKLQQHLD